MPFAAGLQPVYSVLGTNTSVGSQALQLLALAFCSLVSGRLGMAALLAMHYVRMLMQFLNSWPAGTLYLRMRYDKTSGGSHDDISTTLGWARAVLLVLRLQPSGLLWGGVPCGSFVWLSRSVHGTSRRAPCGCLDSEWVQLNNKITARFSLLAMLAVARRCHWACEARSKLGLCVCDYC